MSKILFVVTELRLGGRERVVTNVADIMNTTNEVEIFSVWKRKPFFKPTVPLVYGRGDTNSVKLRKNSSYRIINAVRDRLLFPLVKRMANYSFLQRRRVDELIEYLRSGKFESVVLTDLTMTFAPKIARDIPGINIVGWAHMEPAAFFNDQYSSFKRELIRGINKTNVLIALSEQQATDFARYCDVPTKYIPNPMPEKAELSTLTNHVITVVSRIDIKHKGLDRLVELSKQIPAGWTIRIAGSGKSEDESEFRKLMESTGTPSRIEWTPALKGPKLDSFYVDGAVFLMTSRFEGFPMTLGEAMSHGLPIVAFDIDGTRTVLENGEFGILVKNGDINAMSDRLSVLCGSLAQRQELQQKSLSRIIDFSPAKISSMWGSVLSIPFRE